MKRPAFLFYPDNWRTNANLRRCSWAARGVWIDLMCLMHDSDRYGILEWSLPEIRRSIGCTVSVLNELRDAKVLKGTDGVLNEPFIYVPKSGRREGPAVVLIKPQKGPIWYSSRMVEDEYKRINAGASTRFTSAPRHRQGDAPTQRDGERRGEWQGDVQGERRGEYQGDGSPVPSPIPIPSKTVNGLSKAVTSTKHTGPLLTPVDACKAMRKAGIADVNHSHPDLLALVEAGASLTEFWDAANVAVDGQKGFVYALRIVESRRAMRPSGTNGHNGHEPSWRTEQRERMAKAAPYATPGGPKMPDEMPMPDISFLPPHPTEKDPPQ